MALASAALAFFSRALQASRSRRRFWRSRLSFCRVDVGSSEAQDGYKSCLLKTGKLVPTSFRMQEPLLGRKAPEFQVPCVG